MSFLKTLYILRNLKLWTSTKEEE